MWDLPGPEMEPMSPALAGGFFTTEPPGKPWKCLDEICALTWLIWQQSIDYAGMGEGD